MHCANYSHDKLLSLLTARSKAGGVIEKAETEELKEAGAAGTLSGQMEGL